MRKLRKFREKTAATSHEKEERKSRENIAVQMQNLVKT